MVRAELQGAKLCNADLRGVDLGYANLKGANLSNANLEKSTLTGADLSGACLKDVILWSARLDHADLAFTDLQGAQCRGSNFRRADLSSAVLDRANLDGADLSYGKLTSASTKELSLAGASLAGALFTSDQAELLSPAQIVREDRLMEAARDEHQATRDRLLGTLSLIQALATVFAVVAVGACAVAAAIDAYGLIATGSLRSVTGFAYLPALAFFAAGAVLAGGSAATRLRLYNDERSLRIRAAGSGAQQQD
jgi:hypothetical protein